jgi:two-component sensor histidine kinase/CHASE3 domain sensor protein
MRTIRTIKIIAALTGLTGLTVMVGWIAGIGPLTNVFAGLVTMKFLTAVTFVLAGIDLFAIAKRAEGDTALPRVLLPIASVTIILIMATFLAGALLNVPLGIEEFFVKEAPTEKSVIPGMPSVGTMLAFILFASAASFTALGGPGLKTRLRVLGWLVALMGATAMLGFILDVEPLYYHIPGISGGMALHTAALFVLLGAGLALAGQSLPLPPQAPGMEVKIGYGFSFAFAAMLVIASVSLLNNAKFTETGRQIRESQHLRFALNSLTASLRETEAAFFAFLLTGDDGALDAYRRARDWLAGRRRELLALAAGDRQRSDAVNGLKRALDARLHCLDTGIGLRRSEGADAAARRETLCAGGPAQAVAAGLAAMDAGEERLLARREGEAQAATRTANAVLFAGAPLAFALIALAGYLDVTARERAGREIDRSLMEKELLLKEIHHRVKNNLQIIISLMSLQSAETGDPGERERIARMEGRIRSMAMIHEQLYNATDLSAIDMAEYTGSLATKISQAYCFDQKNIRLVLETSPVLLKIDAAIPCGLILNECITNAVKHAFDPGQPGEIRISLRREGDCVLMAVSDNGKGLPGRFDIATARSLGFQLIAALTDQLRGELRLTTGQGTTIEIVAPLARGGPETPAAGKRLPPIPD